MSTFLTSGEADSFWEGKSEPGDYTVAPVGTYYLRVEGVEAKTDRDGKTYYRVKSKIIEALDGDASCAGKYVFGPIMNKTEKTKERAKEFCASCKMSPNSFDFDSTTGMSALAKECVGKTFKAFVVVNEFNGRKSNEFAKCYRNDMKQSPQAVSSVSDQFSDDIPF